MARGGVQGQENMFGLYQSPTCHGGHIHQYQKVALIYHFILKKSRGDESWDLSSNQQMGMEVQKNLGLLM